MLFTLEDVAKILVESLDLAPLTVTDVHLYGSFGYEDSDTPFRPVKWTQKSLRVKLERALKTEHPDPNSEIHHALRGALERLPHDETCARIGCYFQGFALSEAVSNGVLANNHPDVQTNLLCALNVEQLSRATLTMLHHDIHRFQIEDGVPMKLLAAMMFAVEHDNDELFQAPSGERRTQH